MDAASSIQSAALIESVPSAIAHLRRVAEGDNLRNALADTEVLAEVAAGATATLTSEIAQLERACEILRRRPESDFTMGV